MFRNYSENPQNTIRIENDMNTSLSSLVAYLESAEFDAAMNLFSGFRSFYAALRDNSQVAELVKLIEQSDEARQSLITRIQVLLDEGDANLDYANPHDATLAAYLYVLEQGKHGLLRETLEYLAQLPTLWWARRVADELLQQRLAASQKTAYASVVEDFWSMKWFGSISTSDIKGISKLSDAESGGVTRNRMADHLSSELVML